MPNTEGHSGLRKKVCAICWNESGKKPTRCVSAKEESLIQEYLIEGYLANDEFMPCGLCNKFIYLDCPRKRILLLWCLQNMQESNE